MFNAILPRRLAILLVEDDDLQRTSVAELLRDLGHDVQSAGDAEQAAMILRDQAFDVLFADIGLPGISGEVFAAEARIRQPSLRIVFATGRAGFSRPPADDPHSPVLLRKPYGAEDVQAALRKAMRFG